MNNFFSELKRRNVVRVAIAYVVVAWVVIQIGDIAADNLAFPEWFMPMVFVVLGLGFPIVLIFSWAYEVTPEGVMKTKDVDKSKSVTHGTGQRINKLIAVGFVLALGFIAYDQLVEPVNIVQNGSNREASIAVLPFVNLSSDPEQEYFSDGISEEILNVLVRVEGLSVASRTSAFAYKGSNLSLSTIAEELKVEHVLEGSVRKSGNTIRITAQLIDADTDRHLWSEVYERELTDIFAIQDEISNAIVKALRETLGLESIGSVRIQASTDNMSAYEQFLKGRELFISRSDLGESVRLLENAVAADPLFTRGWEILAAAYHVAPFWGGDDGRDLQALAREAANKAISLDDNSSMAYAVLGSLSTVFGIGDFLEGIDYLNKAVEKDSKNTTALLWRGIFIREVGFFDQSIEDFNACLEIDPAYGNCRAHLAATWHMKGDDKRALALVEENLNFDFIGLDISFFAPIFDSGQRMATFFYVDSSTGNSNAPVSDLMDAYENPEKDHNDGYGKWQEWRKKEGRESWLGFEAVPIVFKAYDDIPLDQSGIAWVWMKIAKPLKNTSYFKEFIRQNNIYLYWETFGYPPHCRPLGDDDFECD